MSWYVDSLPNSPSIHVLPKDDIGPHDGLGFDCECLPAVDYMNGSAIVIHNAWDSRDEWEGQEDE